MRHAAWLYLFLCGCLFASWQSFAQMPMTGAGVPVTAPRSNSYMGPGDVVSSAYAWWGLRAYNASYASGLNKIANVCTPSDVSCADVNSDASGNFNLAGSGLTCNNGGSICTIKTLYDQSGGLNCGGAACDITNSTIASRPTLEISCLGSLPCAVSAGSGYLRSSLSTTGGITPNITFSAVLTRTGNFTGFAGYLSVEGGTGTVAFASSANTITAFFGSAFPTATAADSSWHAAQTALVLGTSSLFYVDGSSTSAADAGTASGAGNLSMFAQGQNPICTCSMTEGGIWAATFNGTQLSAMNSNQHAYWGF